jgi:hypothetical protein
MAGELLSAQLIIWVLFSLISGLITYLILTEGKNKYVLGTTILSSLFIGSLSGIFWINWTNGTLLLSPLYFILPCISTAFSITLLLSFYKLYHKKSFPRVPNFKVGTVVSFLSIIAVISLVFLISSPYMPVAEESSLSPDVAIQILEGQEMSLEFLQVKNDVILFAFISVVALAVILLVYVGVTKKYI